jgi:hypothetical protein
MSIFTNQESWSGGTFDALMYFGIQKVDLAIDITKAIWGAGNLIGPFNRHDSEPGDLAVIQDYAFSEESCEQLYGLITLAGGESACLVQTTLSDSDGLWVYFGPTVGSLPSTWNIGGFPFDDGSPVEWMPSLVEQLRKFVSHVSDVAPIQSAIYGWLDSGDLDTAIDAARGVLPEKRYVSIECFGPQSNGFHAQNAGHYPFTFDAEQGAQPDAFGAG